MASTSNPKISESSGQPPPPDAAASASASARECEACRSAPGIPFCRVDWSFLCIGCASVVHGHNCVVSVPPNPNPNPNNFAHLPYHPYAYPHPFPNPSSDPIASFHLSSEDDDLSPARTDGQGRGWRQITAKATSHRRLESVMRYREKRKSRRFEKTVRYENRRAYAELRPRMDGKFAGRKNGGGKEEEAADDRGGRGGENSGKEGESMGFMGMDRVPGSPDGGAELGELATAGGQLGQHDFVEEEVRFQ